MCYKYNHVLILINAAVLNEKSLRVNPQKAFLILSSFVSDLIITL